MAPDPAVLDELVRRVVDSVHPIPIILFGSAARGEMRQPSRKVRRSTVLPPSPAPGTGREWIERARGKLARHDSTSRVSIAGNRWSCETLSTR